MLQTPSPDAAAAAAAANGAIAANAANANANANAGGKGGRFQAVGPGDIADKRPPAMRRAAHHRRSKLARHRPRQQADAAAQASATPADDGSAAYKATAEASSAFGIDAGSVGDGRQRAACRVRRRRPASAAIAPHVGTSGWDEAFSQKVVFLSNGHQQSAELTLNPKDLGPLQVVLQVTDNHAHALFVSTHAQVRAAVEAALPTFA